MFQNFTPLSYTAIGDENITWIKGAKKSYFMLYLFAIIILFNTRSNQSAFSSYSLRKLAFPLSIFFAYLSFEFDVIFTGFLTFL